MPPYADDIRRDAVDVGGDMIVPMDAAKREEAVGYRLEEDGR